MLCDVFQADRTLPGSQGKLIEAFVAARLAVLAQPEAEALVRALAGLAYTLTASYGRGSAAALAWALQQLGEGAPAAEPARLAQLASQAGLVTLVSAGAALRFSHALVQEYFAALALRDQLSGPAQPPGAQGAGQLKRYPESNWQQGWEETLLVLGSLNAGPGPIGQRVRDGLSADPLLAARLLTGGAGGADPELAGLLRSIALEQIGDPTAHARQRLAAGQALGLVGDPRAPASLQEWRSELGRASERFGRHNTYWCYVQPGAYQIGAWKAGQPAEDLALGGFWIGRLPITVAQFSAFVGTGYAEGARRWWTRTGWAWRQAQERVGPGHWDEPAYTAGNQPVVGVSWYEAAAFCAWLSEQLRDALPTGYVVRLPSEAEWEAAAAFDGQQRRHPYPWGSAQPTPDHAIFSESRLSSPAPAGCCPAGAAHCGALDLLGNIEEWCASWFGAYPAGSHAAAEEPPSGNDILLGPLTGNQVAARGGWWAHRAAQLGCGSRFWYYASAASHTIGFRVVLAAPLGPGG
jgi:formylglycine-generating enzyme required for sulfatase activity